MTTFEGNFSATGKRFGIIVSRFNELITSKLLEGAKDALFRHGVEKNDVDVTWVPGAFEIPLATKMMAQSGNYNALITLGAVIRGATSHYDVVCSEVSKGVSQVSLSSGIPCMFGVLTTDTIEQALERAGTKAGNKGWETAMGAIEMASLTAQLNSSR